MGQTLYWECDFGISGDMAAASLLDLGADEKALLAVLESLPVEGFETEITRVKKAGLDVCDFNVKLDAAHENHDHDMEYLHGEGHTHEHEDGQAHAHRSYAEVKEILAGADMNPRARETALRIFRVLAEAEARAHGVDIEEVHFHEVGAVDSIVDVVAVAVCLDLLDITQVIVPYLCEGRGTVRSQHGILPIPVPAVANIAADSGLTLKLTETMGELVTPTGAAVVAATATDDSLPEKFAISNVGMGAGKREYDTPGILRAMLIEAVE
jgi:uncharacterized protein (TIGR00299 family) protein